MSAIALSSIAFVCIAGGVLAGMLLRNTLPEHHLNSDAKDVVRLGTGLIGAIAALVLGLLIGPAKSSYDLQSAQIKQMTANIVLLDNFLAQYGPETGAARDLMRKSVVVLADRMWRENSSKIAKTAPFEASTASDVFYTKLQELSPQNDAQRSLQARAIQTSTDIAQTRFLLFTQTDNSIRMPFLVVLIFWLTIIFASFSLFARPNVIVVASLFIFWLSAAGGYLLDPGVGPAVRRTNADFQRTASKRPRAYSGR
jgi:hypothetical protein